MEILIILAVILFIAQIIGKAANTGKKPVRPPTPPRDGMQRPLEDWFQTPSAEKEVDKKGSMNDFTEAPHEAESQEQPAPVMEHRMHVPASPIEDDEIGRKAPLLKMSRGHILQGIIFSEIIGPPKSRR